MAGSVSSLVDRLPRLLVGISKPWCMLPEVTDNLGKNKWAV